MIGVTWHPLAPPALLAIALAACVVGLVWMSHRAHRIRVSAALRIAVAAVCAVLIANPQQWVSSVETSAPPLRVLIDDSRSMGVESEDGISRFELIRRQWFGAAARESVQRQFDVQFRSAAAAGVRFDSSQLAALAPVRSKSEIHAAIEDVIRDSSGGAVLVLSDGIETLDTETDVDAIGALAAARDVRIDVVVPGDVDLAPNVRVLARAEPPVVFERQPVSLIIDVLRAGQSSEPVELTVFAGDDGRNLAHREILAPAVVTRRVIRAPTDWAAGDSADFRVRVTAIKGERDLSDNQQDVIVDILDDAARVILFEGQPYWETSFIIDVLRADPSIALTTVTALSGARDVVRHPRRMASPPTVESLLDNLDAFDVVILGKGIERWFDGEGRHALESFVLDHGGGLFIARDQPVSADDADADALRALMARLSPLELGGQRAAGGVLGLPPDAGENNLMAEDALPGFEAALDGLPGVVSATRENTERAMSTVLLRWAPRSVFGGDPTIQVDDPPALAAMRIGAGRTMALTSEGLWRWAMAPDASSESRQLYGSLLSRLTRWLALGGAFQPGRELSVQVDPGPHEPGEMIEIVIRSRTPQTGSPLRVSVTDPRGSTKFLALGNADADARWWSASFRAMDEGVYTIRAAIGEHETTARTTVYVHDREVIDVAPRRAAMEALALATGGRMWPMSAREAYLESLGQDRSAIESRRAMSEPAWPKLWVFVVVIALLTGVWIADRWERGV